MKITIHRGLNQIGGCITEIATDEAKIIIDLGSNLPGNNHPDFSKEKIGMITHGANAIFYTHFHGDHVGLMKYVTDSNIVQYMGQGAVEVMQCKFNALSRYENHSDEISFLQKMKPYFADVPIEIKNKSGEVKMIVTPYFVSHSAFDSYMFKIEVENKVILHTGDFREHGYLGKGLLPVIDKYIHQVDILITEGTMLSRNSEHVLHEFDIKNNTVAYLKKHKYVFALCSSTDLDRLASFHDACKLSNRAFLCDSYQAEVFKVFTKYAGSKSSFFIFDQYDGSGYLDREKVQQTGFLRLIRSSMDASKLQNLLRFVPTDEKPCLIYSMWRGYHEGTPSQISSNIVAIRSLFDKDCIADGTRDGFHTSGHATIETIADVCDKVRPRIGIIAIHKDEHTTLKSTEISRKYRIIEDDTSLENIDFKLA